MDVQREESVSSSNMDNKKEKNEEKRKNETISNEKNIGVTEVKFRRKFNQIADEELSELHLHLTKDYVFTGTYANVYQIPLDSTTSLVISYEPDTELVRGIFLSGHLTDQDKYVLFLGAVAGIVATLNPGLSPSGRRDLLQEIGMFDGKHTIHNVANLSTY